MMGEAASSLDIPIIKDTLGVIALTERETGPLASQKQYPCIRCGACVEACPMFLNPSWLGLLAAAWGLVGVWVLRRRGQATSRLS